MGRLSEELSVAECRFLQGFDDLLETRGFAPNYAELAEKLGYESINSVSTHVKKLVTYGYLRKKAELKERKLVLTEKGLRALGKTKPETMAVSPSEERLLRSYRKLSHLEQVRLLSRVMGSVGEHHLDIAV